MLKQHIIGYQNTEISKQHIIWYQNTEISKQHILRYQNKIIKISKRPKSWSYGSWIYNYLCNQCLSPLTLWVRTPLRRDILNTTLCNQVCQWFATGRWFSPGTLVSPTNKSEHLEISQILLKVALSTLNQTITIK